MHADLGLFVPQNVPLYPKKDYGLCRYVISESGECESGEGSAAAPLHHSAIDRPVESTLFVFPHRARELGTFREYIVGLFAATSSLFHDRIIAFDKAARKRVSQRRDLELTDFNQFLDIKTAVIDSIGVGVVDAHREPSSGPARKQKSQACNNWNSGRCTADAGTCRGLHICNALTALTACRTELVVPIWLRAGGSGTHPAVSPFPFPYHLLIPPRWPPGAAPNDRYDPDVPAAPQAAVDDRRSRSRAGHCSGLAIDPNSSSTYTSADPEPEAKASSSQRPDLAWLGKIMAWLKAWLAWLPSSQSQHITIEEDIKIISEVPWAAGDALGSLWEMSQRGSQR
ncbi:hypothetical protein B0H11DRAFT_1918266 [Mycena galericulata]|nr:hypothetical protein B0H11DRAFT_1918266 [Mycena galericulata]